jgi:hypothetical protein
LLLAASLVRMAATSTVAAGAAPGAADGFAAAAAPGAADGFAAAAGDPAGAADAPAGAALAWPKIVDTIFPRMLIKLSLHPRFQCSAAGRGVACSVTPLGGGMTNDIARCRQFFDRPPAARPAISLPADFRVC